MGGVWTGSRRIRVVAVGVLALATLVRAPFVWGGLPYLHHPDEVTNLRIAERMVREDDPNPSFFNYPSLMFYVEAGVMEATYGWRTADDEPAVQATETVGNARAVRPAVVILLRWTLGILPALGTVAAAMAIAWRATRVTWVAGLAGLFVALNPLGLRFGTSITPDSLASATSGLAVLAAVWLLERPRLANYVMAGAAVGAAASAKYNAVLTTVALGISHLFVAGLRPSRRTLLMGAAALASIVVAFVALTPYSVLDRSGFLTGLRAERDHYRTGHTGSDGGAPAFYASWLFRGIGPALLLLPAAQFVPGKIGRRCVTVALGFSVVYVVFISSFPVRFARNLLPTLAPLSAVAAIAVFTLARWATARWNLNSPQHGRFKMALASLGLVALLAWPLLDDRRAIADATRDPWADAQEWLERNVPEGSHIAVEAYGFYVDPGRYQVMTRLTLSPGSADWYANQGVDYLVSSERLWMRFIDDPTARPGQTAAYTKLLDETCTRYISDQPRGERLLILDPSC